jgi:hypothetical protein
MAHQLKLPRIKNCSTEGCNALGLATDGKCMDHTSTQTSSLYTIRYSPTTHDIENPFGVELECVCRDYDIRKITECVVDDYSIYDDGHEMKFLADASEIGIKSAEAARKAQLLGARINSQCGFHVHMSLPKGVSGVTNSKALKIFEIAEDIEHEMFSLFPGRDGNDYCHRLEYDDEIYDHSSWLSISENHPTVEVRIHSGTLSPSKIYAWTKVCEGLQEVIHEAIIGRSDELRRKVRRDGLFGLFDTGTVARDYLEARKNQGGRNVRFEMEVCND